MHPCGRALRHPLRLIAAGTSVEFNALLTNSRIQHSDRASFRRDHRRARVPHRGNTRQQPVARPAVPRPGRPDGDDAVLRTDARRSGAPADELAHPGAPSANRRGAGATDALTPVSTPASLAPLTEQVTPIPGSVFQVPELRRIGPWAKLTCSAPVKMGL